MFKDQVVMVTGAAAGIGLAVVKKFASEGADICMCDLNSNALASLHEEIVQLYNTQCMWEGLDVSDHKSVKSFVDNAYEKFSHIDVLVNCAGIFNKKDFFKLTIEEWYQMIAIHLHGTFLFTYYVSNYMKNKNKGCIINIGSTSGISGGTSGCHYAAAKGGVIAFTKSVGKELAPYGIHVNAVAPSKIKTNMLQFKTSEEEKSLIEKIPARRLGTPEEIASIIAFLASNEADYIVGEVIVASGGY